MSVNLNPEKALIFRIVHVDNVPWILDHEMHCRSSDTVDPNYVNIGKPDLIQARRSRDVPMDPGGTLSDYVPFYFTPFSIMMYNIKTGYDVVEKRRNEEIVIFVSSLHRLRSLDVPFLFTNGHAYTAYVDFFSDLDDLAQVDWPLLRARDFRHDPDDPGKKDRYQAEALVHRQVPLGGFLGIGCHDVGVKADLDGQLAERGLNLDVKVTRTWYF